jgi:glycosyltransferase involved in cell wall biosynthesis
MSEPIRVLHIHGSTNRGGAEALVISLFHKIDRTKVMFDFVKHTYEPCEYDDEIKSLGGRIFCIPPFRGYNYLAYRMAFSKLYENHPEIKIVHGHVRSTAAIYLNIAKNFNKVTVMHSHNTSNGKKISSIPKKIFQNFILSDYYFACSRSAGEWCFGKKKCRNNNFILLNNAIDLERFVYNNEIRKAIRLNLGLEEKLVVGHVGRMISQKNPFFLIDVFKAVHDKNNNAILLYIGTGELQAQIKRKIDNLGLTDSVIFFGTCNNVNEMMQAMDVFLLPSRWEGLAIVLIEAQTAGLKCITTDSKLFAKDAFLTNLVNYLPFDFGANRWADAVLDASRAPRMSCHFINKMKDYDINKISTWLLNFYLKIYTEKQSD